MSTRTYTSPARDRKKLETRDRILDALVEVILVDGLHAFSVQNVADRAGITHRTVYRHFPSREDLLEGLADRLVRDMSDQVDPEETLSADAMRRSYRAFASAADQIRAGVIASLSLDVETGDRSRRTQRMHKAFVAQFPHLPREEVELTFRVVRELLASSRAWFLLHRAGLDSARAGDEVARIYDLVVDDLHRRNDAMRK